MSRTTVSIRRIPRTVLVPLALLLALGVYLTVASMQAHSAESALLPDLVADPPDNVSLETSTTDGGLKPEEEERLLLRFNGYIHNRGPGALDIRGSRVKPNESLKEEEEVEHAREQEEELPQKVEEKLATPPMKAFQRVFTTNAEETNIERPHKEEPSNAELIYVSADGHHHWHLQHAARYSLWNGAKSAEVAPAQKVGFCLDDSEHVKTELNVGPKTAVYADNVPPFRDFCQKYRPDATSLFEGISPGWRDIYDSSLGLQWVEASDVLPGEYWLREEVNPVGVIKETGGTNAPVYSACKVIIPGYDAQAQTVSVGNETPKTVTLTSNAWSSSGHSNECLEKQSLGPAKYTIVSQPQHGKLSAVSKSHVTYTPNPGYSGPDSFTFSAAEPNSEFPRSPALATVSIEVAKPTEGETGGPLVGDATSTYSEDDTTTAGHEEAFQFTAKSTGTVNELQFRTNATANNGITGVVLGIFTENGGKPGEVLGQARVSGQPSTNSWIKATGLSTAVVAGTTYWLVALPLGSNQLHFNAAAESGGNLESSTGGLSALTPEGSWDTYDQGPVGFQALGHEPGVTIEGAPSSMLAGTSVSLNAAVRNDSSGVIWEASAGTITPAGQYTAPGAPGTVTITVRLKDDTSVSEQRVISILAVPTPTQAPAAPLPEQKSSQAANKLLTPAVGRPQALLVGRTLVMTTWLAKAGRARLSAYLGKRLLGTCVVETPANRSLTCRVKLGSRVSLHASITVWASLRIGSEIVRSLRAASPVPKMKMPRATELPSTAHVADAAQFICSPSMVAGMERALTSAQAARLVPALLYK